ncbi:MAG: GlsB/YeaQ/YmgE family stress response membrane protein [Candidatus Aquicultorales bacterium]
MGWIVLIIVGGIIGWIASIIMGTNSQQGILANIVVGIVGSLLGKWVFADLLGIGSAQTAGEFSIFGIIWGVIGAIILIVILRWLGIFG